MCALDQNGPIRCPSGLVCRGCDPTVRGRHPTGSGRPFLGHIHGALGDIIAEWQPQEVAIEQVFLSNNPMSALKLGQARGAAITAAVSRQLIVAEYAPRLVKKVVTGSGSADKKQVQIMVRALLQIIPVLQVDAADGLAIAICHAHSRKSPGGNVLPQRKRTRGRGLRL